MTRGGETEMTIALIVRLGYWFVAWQVSGKWIFGQLRCRELHAMCTVKHPWQFPTMNRKGNWLFETGITMQSGGLRIALTRKLRQSSELSGTIVCYGCVASVLRLCDAWGE